MGHVIKGDKNLGYIFPEIRDNGSLIKELQMALKSYDMVLLVVDGEGITEKLTKRVEEYFDKRNITKSILVMSKNVEDDKNGKVKFRHISREYETAILSIYRMYEFSDHFSVLIGDMRYGNILNYVENGKMTWNEVLDAVLWGS